MATPLYDMVGWAGADWQIGYCYWSTNIPVYYPLPLGNAIDGVRKVYWRFDPSTQTIVEAYRADYDGNKTDLTTDDYDTYVLPIKELSSVPGGSAYTQLFDKALLGAVASIEPELSNAREAYIGNTLFTSNADYTSAVNERKATLDGLFTFDPADGANTGKFCPDCGGTVYEAYLARGNTTHMHAAVCTTCSAAWTYTEGAYGPPQLTDPDA